MPLTPLASLRQVRRRDLRLGLVAALVLAVPDLGRQLPVRDDPSYAHALLVDVLGVLSATVAQVALVGLLAGARAGRWLAEGVRLVLRAVLRHPRQVLAGLVAAGAVSALLTLVPSLLLLGRQVIGPLHDPPLWRLVLAQGIDVVATAVTAPWFAVHVRGLAAAR